ncbi:MAG TPA: MarR family transcriptional regulator [Pseudonocardiaceae bacterium]|nr:MarR family transcriptional regulator [Pseudonocardiaceae bacterium]
MPERAELLARLTVAAQHSVTDGVVLHQIIADKVGLHVTDLRCLNLLRLSGPATPGELAAATGLTTGAITRMVDRMLAAGYVRREHDPVDRRRVIVSVAPERIAEIGPLYDRVAAGWAELLTDYTDEQLAVVLGLFNRAHEMTVALVAELRKELT